MFIFSTGAQVTRDFTSSDVPICASARNDWRTIWRIWFAVIKIVC